MSARYWIVDARHWLLVAGCSILEIERYKAEGVWVKENRTAEYRMLKEGILSSIF